MSKKTVTIAYEVKPEVEAIMRATASREGVSKAVLGRRALLQLLGIDADGNPREVTR